MSKELSLHPINLKPDTNGNLPPSALVPFCFYQEDHNRPGPTKFCDKFEPTILEGQLCYSLNVTKFERKATKTGKKNGLFLLLDPNPYPVKSSNGRVKNAKNDQESFKVYIHTLTQHSLFGPGVYSMHILKKMTGTESFRQLQDNKKNCQVHSRELCQTIKFLERVKENCNCVPWLTAAEKNNSEVSLIINQLSNFTF